MQTSHFFKPATKKRKLSTTDTFAKIVKASEAFVFYQQAVDRSFLAAEEARERREKKKGRRKGGRPRVSDKTGASTSKIKSTRFQQFHLRSYLRQFELVKFSV